MPPFSIPIFPLPSVVLFPNVLLPLHIFEPRYRQMVEEALAGDRMIGMVLLKPGFEANYEGAPAVYRTGCAGLITRAERLEDGRFNMVLRGVEKFTIRNEDAPAPGRLYRSAVISPQDESVPDGDRESLTRERTRLLAILTPVLADYLQSELPAGMPDEDLVNALAQYLNLDPIEKLALLERDGVLARCRGLIELLEMKSYSKDDPTGPVH
jgi:Lon protease-like protein